MRRLTLLLTCCVAIFTAMNVTEANQPYESWLSKQWTRFENAEKKCREEARKLIKLDVHQLHFKGEWDDNREDIRDEAISGIGGSIQMDILAAISSYLSSAVKIGLDVHEDMSLTEILNTAIRKTKRSKAKLEKLVETQIQAYDSLIDYIDTHDYKSEQYPGTHGHTSPSDNIEKPDKEDFSEALNINTWEFDCKGGCEMPMDSPISSHRQSCPGGDDHYYHDCNTMEVNWHKERPCTRNIRVRWERRSKTGATYYQYTNWVCTVKHRWCSPNAKKGPHYIKKDLDATRLGTYTTHRPSPPRSARP